MAKYETVESVELNYRGGSELAVIRRDREGIYSLVVYSSFNCEWYASGTLRECREVLENLKTFFVEV